MPFQQLFNCSQLHLFDFDSRVLARVHKIMKPEHVSDLIDLGNKCGKNTRVFR